MKKLQRLLFYILMSVFVSGCSDSSENSLDTKPGAGGEPSGEAYELKDEVVDMSDEMQSHVVSAVGDKLVFQASVSQDLLPEVGEVIMVDKPSAKFPNGYLRRVKSISQSGDVIIETEPVALDEVFAYLDVKGSTTLQMLDAAATKGLDYPLYFTGEVSFLDVLTGAVDYKGNLKLDYEFFIDQTNGKNLKKANVKAEYIHDLELTAELGCSLPEPETDKVNVGKALRFTPITLGPLVLVPAIQLGIMGKFEGNISAMWMLNHTKDCSWHWIFDHGKWSSSVDEKSNEWTFSQNPTLKVKGEAMVAPSVSFELRLYDNEDNKLACNGFLGPSLSGQFEVDYGSLQQENDNACYESMKDSKIEMNVALGGNFSASAKFFLIEADFESPIVAKNIFSKSTYLFPEFKNEPLSLDGNVFSAQTVLRHDLIWKQQVGLALYKEDELIKTSPAVEYKSDVEGGTMISATFDELNADEKDAYSVWTYMVWGDKLLKCKQVNFEPLVGKWYPEDCTCNPRCHYLFRADHTGYYSETFGGEVAKREFTWEYDGTYLKTTSNNPDPGDDGVETEKIRFEGKDKFTSFGADFDYEETPQNTTVYIRALE